MNSGIILKISGPVIDVGFPAAAKLPSILDALTVETEKGVKVMEVQQHVDRHTVRAVILSESDGLTRGMRVVATGKSIEVPVGEKTLGRLFNVLGEPIDGKGALAHSIPRRSIHRKSPSFSEQTPIVSVLETGIKAIDLLEPYPKGGKIGLFGGAGVGKTVLIQELIFMEENLMVFLKDKNLDMKWLEELLKKVLMSQIVFN